MLYVDLSQRNYLPHVRNKTGHYLCRFIYGCHSKSHPAIFKQILSNIFLETHLIHLQIAQCLRYADSCIDCYISFLSINIPTKHNSSSESSQEIPSVLQNPNLPCHNQQHTTLVLVPKHKISVHFKTKPIFEEPFYYYPPICAYVLQVVSFPQVFPL